MKLVSCNKLENNKVALEVTVTAEEFQPVLDVVYRKHAKEITLRQYTNLLTLEIPSDLPEGKTYNDYIDPNSRVIVEHAMAEPALLEAVENGNKQFQFVRDGYYVPDSKLPNTFNRTVGLKDSFQKN